MFDQFIVPPELRPSDPRFACGPSLVPVTYLQNLAKTGVELMGTSHRKSAVKNLCKEIQEGLKKYFQVPDDYEVVMGNGGATLLFDMIGLGMVESKSAHFTCGEFSSKWYKSHKMIPWIETYQESVEYGEGITPVDIPDCDLLAMTLNETSTGVIVDKIPAKTQGLVCVDATSGGGQVACDLSLTDVFFFSPQKVFASDGGLFIAIMSPRAIERALKIAQDKKRYIPEIMNWQQAIENSRKNQTYNTPAIATLFFLNEQVKKLNQLGYQQVIESTQKKAKLVYDWAESKPYLAPYVKEQRYRSNAVATIDVNDQVDVESLLKVLRTQKAVYDIDAYRKLGRNQFRIALFENIAYDDLEKLTQLLSLAIEKEI